MTDSFQHLERTYWQTDIFFS
ncbi:hypothetical protein CMALT394_330021 [Carnobacterium maltaromaticum]|nr:hypothetical protein CMALT394_330021 [Carnobacterium maltaromaticum]